MDKVDNTFGQAGDKYAKRLLDRSQYSERYSQSYRRRSGRRLSVMEALNGNSANLSPSRRYEGNPFEKEFSQVNKADAAAAASDDQLEMTYVSTWPEDNTDLSSRTYDVEPTAPSRDSLFCVKSLDDAATEYTRGSEQFRRDIVDAARLESIDALANLRLSRHTRYDPTLPVGERFGPLTTTELTMQSTLNQQYDSEFEQGNANMKLQGVDEFFGARVIEICEPVIIKFHRKSCDSEAVGTQTLKAELTYIEESDSSARPSLQTDQTYVKPNEGKARKEKEMDLESERASLNSELMRDIDREIDRVQSEHDIAVSPPRITSAMPKTASARIPEDAVDGFRERDQVKPFGRPVNQTPPNNYKAYQKQASPKNATFAAGSSSRHNMSKTASFIKRHTSFLFKNLRSPKLVRRKSSVESSTRNKTTIGSPWPQAAASALARSNTMGSSDAEKPATMFQRQLRLMQADLPPDMDDTMTSEMENFLRVALGSGRYNSTMAHGNFDAPDRTYSLLSQDEPDSGRSMREPRSEPPKRSGTLNRTLSMYKTLTQKIRDKFRKYEHTDAKPSVLTIYQQNGAMPDDLTLETRQTIRKLEERVSVQDTLIYQTSKALQLCESMREFTVSPERVEYERVLLLASLTKRTVQREIDRLKCQCSYNNNEAYAHTERGEVTLKNISLQLRQDMLLRERQNGNVVEWFVVVVVQGLTVWATEAVACPISSTQIYFEDKHIIAGLAPDFRLSIKVYSIRLQQQQLYNHSEKYHIPKSKQAHQAGSKAKTPKLMRKSLSPKQFKVKFTGIKETAFVFCGGADLMLYDLKLPSPWPLNSLVSNTVLQGTIDLSLSCKLELSIFHAGFLTHCEETGDLAWSRRWCLLEGHQLLFWNYPREQEYKPPLYSIDLVDCVASSVELIDRKLCPRPRTLLLETRSKAIVRENIILDNSGPAHRHLLSCDNSEELTEWHSKLNHVVSALSDWNIIHTS